MKLQNVHVTFPQFDLDGLIEAKLSGEVVGTSGVPEAVALDISAPAALFKELLGGLIHL
jgi:hypothetical protein